MRKERYKDAETKPRSRITEEDKEADTRPLSRRKNWGKEAEIRHLSRVWDGEEGARTKPRSRKMKE